MSRAWNEAIQEFAAMTAMISADALVRAGSSEADRKMPFETVPATSSVYKVPRTTKHVTSAGDFLETAVN